MRCTTTNSPLRLDGSPPWVQKCPRWHKRTKLHLTAGDEGLRPASTAVELQVRMPAMCRNDSGSGRHDARCACWVWTGKVVPSRGGVRVDTLGSIWQRQLTLAVTLGANEPEPARRRPSNPCCGCRQIGKPVTLPAEQVREGGRAGEAVPEELRPASGGSQARSATAEPCPLPDWTRACTGRQAVWLVHEPKVEGATANLNINGSGLPDRGDEGLLS